LGDLSRKKESEFEWPELPQRGIAVNKEENFTTDEHEWGEVGELGMNLNSGRNNDEDKLQKARKGERRREPVFLLGAPAGRA
jgi:hypothetical protein